MDQRATPGAGPVEVWDHAGTCSVRSRDIHQQIGRAEKRLHKLNAVEAFRLEVANTTLTRAMRACRGAEEGAEAARAVQEGARVGQQLATSDQGHVPQEGVGKRLRPRVSTQTTRVPQEEEVSGRRQRKANRL